MAQDAREDGPALVDRARLDTRLRLEEVQDGLPGLAIHFGQRESEEDGKDHNLENIVSRGGIEQALRREMFHDRVKCYVHGGELFFKPDVAQDFFREYVLKSGKLDVPSSRRLSPREQEALSLVVAGLASKEIADRLQIQKGTVEKHRQSLMKKLNIHTAAGLTTYAISEGVLQLDLAQAAEQR